MTDLIFVGVFGILILGLVCGVLGLVASALWLRLFWKRWKETNRRIENARREILERR